LFVIRVAAGVGLNDDAQALVARGGGVLAARINGASKRKHQCHNQSKPAPNPLRRAHAPRLPT
jgi:hypothetical protein